MKYPFHIIARKKISDFLNAFLAKFSRNKNLPTSLNNKEIETIVIIRPNYRIGNLIFLTPFINELQKYFPHAKIDIIVGLKLAGNILEPMPNVNRIIDIPRKMLLHPLALLSYIKQTRKTTYDLAINMSGPSTSAQIVTSLLKANNKVSFQGAKKLWTKLTHLQVRGQKHYNHMGLESLEFLRFFQIPFPNETPTLDIKLTQEEKEIAKKDFTTLFHNHNISSNKKVIAIFRNARFDKKISDNWWNEWFEALINLDNEITVIDILSPDIPKKLNSNVLKYSNKNLRVLGAFFTLCDLFISADTGPMHLAVASQAKVLALFNKTDIATYGALGTNNTTIDIEDLSAQDVAKITLKKLSNQCDPLRKI
ncbi:glycosyltransferase family 9 protein [Sulfurimonas paralvinellae]|uniref:Glycosyltransferase family 9 protein n=1 Tax=Sulfurimonas paralvinellae TaxID=317658 RepID=A0A7M1BBA9_9BACT|nr:glycosyltransferase family 9 protein [Sulfurimonas paralvinellae]QOP46108.1 glycosyltransferase family 9 protein [Sulfurimonas paralvinellae]